MAKTQDLHDRTHTCSPTVADVGSPKTRPVLLAPTRSGPFEAAGGRGEPFELIIRVRTRFVRRRRRTGNELGRVRGPPRRADKAISPYRSANGGRLRAGLGRAEGV